MAELDFLKKNIEEKKAAEKKTQAPISNQAVDLDQVEKIVDKMKKKYKEEGLEFEGVEGKLGDLRSEITGGKTSSMQIQNVEELAATGSPMVQRIGSIYLKFRKFFDSLSNIVLKLPQVEKIDYYIYSANLKFSLKQYVAITSVLTVLSAIVGFIVLTLLTITLDIDLATKFLLIVLCTFFVAVISMLVVLSIPQSIARKRGDEITVELPFALRHMSTELKSGVGLYRTIQTIASADYGVLSEEFSRTIREIEDGTDTKDALKHMSLRVQSKDLSNALNHIVRALKTGGNLSEIMAEIAEDVSFSIQNRIRDFSEKMNFFGVIFIFVAIVAPVMVSILGGIRNTPISTATGGNVFSALPLDSGNLAVFYLILMPVILLMMILYIRSIQPKM